MNFNFNNVVDAYNQTLPLQRIYGSGNYLLWEKDSGEEYVDVIPDDVLPYYSEYLTIEALENGSLTLRTQYTTEYIKIKVNDGSWINLTDLTFNSNENAYELNYSVGDVVYHTGFNHALLYFTASTGIISHGGGTISYDDDGYLISRLTVDNNCTLYISTSRIHTDDTKTIQYNKNNSGWNSITFSSIGNTINFNQGDKIKFRGYHTHDISFYTEDNIKAYGNVLSMLFQNNFSDIKVLNTSEYELNLSFLFYYCTGLKDIEYLVLPLTSPRNEYYSKDVVAGWESDIYQGMFFKCNNLLTPMKYLPQVTPVDDSNGYERTISYSQMFAGCSSMTTSPKITSKMLSATQMFWNCENLSHVECLSSNISSQKWLYNVSQNGTFIKKGSVSWKRGDSGIPYNWTISNYKS